MVSKQQDIQPKSILERVQAFVQLRFNPVIDQLAKVKDQKKVELESRNQLQDLTNFFLGELEYEDAVEFLQSSFQFLFRKKLISEGKDPGPEDEEADILKLIKFKPTHNSFKKLQESYVDARLHLTNQTLKGQRRLAAIETELDAEQEQFSNMCNQFMQRDGKITKQVIDDNIAGTNVAANSRKREIFSLFQEVQKTQQQLNKNLIKEVKSQVAEQQLILNGINASVAEFTERINKAINLKLEQVKLAANNTLRLDDCPDCTKKLDDFQPTFIKYVGSKLILAWGYKLQGNQNQLVWEDSNQIYFFSADDLRLVASVSCKSKSVKVFSAVGSQKDIYVACERKILIFGKSDLKLKKQIMLDHQPLYMDEDGKKAILGCREGSINYILFDTLDKAKEKQQFKVDIAKVMFSRDAKKFALVDKQRDLISQFDRDHWLQFALNDGSFEIKNPETGSIIPVQLDNLERYSYSADGSGPEPEMKMVEMAAHPLFWHDSNQYLVVRDEDDNVNLTRVKVQMDMALANSLNQTEDNPEGTTKVKYLPQEGRFIDVYSGPNQSLVILGVTANGTLWKKELYKGFFDIFNS